MAYFRCGGSVAEEYSGATTVTPSTSNQVLATADKLVNSDITVYGDADLVASKIKYGANIFGVAGSVRQYGAYNYNGQCSNSLSLTVGFTTKVFAFFKDGDAAYSSCGFSGCGEVRNGNSGSWFNPSITSTTLGVTMPSTYATYQGWASGYY